MVACRVRESCILLTFAVLGKEKPKLVVIRVSESTLLDEREMVAFCPVAQFTGRNIAVRDVSRQPL